jgi:hypothetical protein
MASNMSMGGVAGIAVSDIRFCIRLEPKVIV